jgi:hypothetical protein
MTGVAVAKTPKVPAVSMAADVLSSKIMACGRLDFGGALGVYFYPVFIKWRAASMALLNLAVDCINHWCSHPKRHFTKCRADYLQVLVV